MHAYTTCLGYTLCVGYTDYHPISCHVNALRIPPRELFGQFGYQTARTSWRKTQDQTLDVCLKATYTDEGADRADRIKMLQEAAVLAQFRHPNVVRLHGLIYKENVVRSFIVDVDKSGN